MDPLTAVVLLLQRVDWLLLLSVIITLAHTADEVFGEGGPIWDYLAGVTGLSAMLWLGGYALFQASLLVSAWAGLHLGLVAPLVFLAAARVVDFGLTHVLLAGRFKPNPGKATRLLLLLDPFVWAGVWLLA